ncbi:methylated-DNA--[protein]-cysteine S-methyltransferase [Paenibacillus beijingensis]|uniref:Methylated-DNA--protein-cysteine methyltransferase n=1 Tax=Paenibacillus beijingensis TaxID=1126833 RepID=A0A0D5NJ55_9BACL|nr:methylated-DNA--[protein]-cysteine S-methyltransferase [Paenibacillus beijingensis]AJY75115.1 cysteine methyltransferase [Paenibacillus beijingensis]
MGSNTNRSIYWTLLEHADWNIHLAASSEGLCYIGSQNRPFEELAGWTNARFPACTLIRDDEKLKRYAAELREYLQGARQRFTIPFDVQGTPFQRAVWHALCGIPYGQTRSYSDIAGEIGRPAAVRAVGAAIGANPILITIPCHRVIGKNGALTGYRGGIGMKTKLLQLERDGASVDPSRPAAGARS